MSHDLVPPPVRFGVIAVVDSHGGGADFAYTVGLHDAGYPELHLWARPTIGTDPGADVRLSSRDQGVLLHRFAGLMIAGDLRPDLVHVVVLDDGANHAYVRVGELVHPDEVDAFAVEEGAAVLPLRWELRRGAR